jgi:hypothetical protein
MHSKKKSSSSTFSLGTIHEDSEMPPPPRKETSFLTVDPTGSRAPSAYHVDLFGISQRARQEHKGGAALTKAMPAVHAFTESKVKRDIVHALVKGSMEKGIDGPMALRMEIMDGLASPIPHAGDAHQEAFPGGLKKGNPHKSGGLVKFAETGSALADFDTVASQTSAIRAKEKLAKRRAAKGSLIATHIPTPIIDHTTTSPTLASDTFSFSALSAQRAWARSILTPKG